MQNAASAQRTKASSTDERKQSASARLKSLREAAAQLFQQKEELQLQLSKANARLDHAKDAAHCLHHARLQWASTPPASRKLLLLPLLDHLYHLYPELAGEAQAVLLLFAFAL